MFPLVKKFSSRYIHRHFSRVKIKREFYGATGTVRVIQGISGINTISFVVNTSDLKPDEYIVTEDAIIRRSTGGALFNVLPAPVHTGKLP